MSRLVRQVLSSDTARSTDRFVLVVLASHADNDGLSFPSQTQICSETRYDRKTVIDSMARLASSGLIVDTKERKGRTRQVVVYRVQLKGKESGTLSTTENTHSEAVQAVDIPPVADPMTLLIDAESVGDFLPFGSNPDCLQFPISALKGVESPTVQASNEGERVGNLGHGTKEERKKERENGFPIFISRGVNVIDFPIVKADKTPKNKPKTAIDPMWQPSEADIAFADARGVDPFSLVDSFIAHHEMHGKVMASWAAAWRTWVLNTIRFNSQRPGGRIDPKEGRRAAYANPKFGSGF